MTTHCHSLQKSLQAAFRCFQATNVSSKFGRGNLVNSYDTIPYIGTGRCRTSWWEDYYSKYQTYSHGLVLLRDTVELFCLRIEMYMRLTSSNAKYKNVSTQSRLISSTYVFDGVQAVQ